MAQYWHWAWDVAYGPFGEVAGVWADPGVTQDMRFPGQWFQMESGLAYNWHRHYDATLGRYVQPDPIGYAGGQSLYGYAGQNPLAYGDLDGRNPVIAIAALCARFPQACVATAMGVTTWLAEQYYINRSTDIELPEIAGAFCPKDPCKNMRENYEEHVKKLARYVNDPVKEDHKGVLGGSYDQNIIRSRIKHLQDEIRAFKNDLEKCEKENGI